MDELDYDDDDNYSSRLSSMKGKKSSNIAAVGATRKIGGAVGGAMGGAVGGAMGGATGGLDDFMPTNGKKTTIIAAGTTVANTIPVNSKCGLDDFDDFRYSAVPSAKKGKRNTNGTSSAAAAPAPAEAIAVVQGAVGGVPSNAASGQKGNFNYIIDQTKDMFPKMSR